MEFKTIEELEKHIKSTGFGIEAAEEPKSAEPVYLSAGIRATYNIKDSDIQNALDLFLSGKYGGFYDYDETPTAGREYGEYKSKLGETAHTGAIMIHRENGNIIIYYHFER